MPPVVPRVPLPSISNAVLVGPTRKCICSVFESRFNYFYLSCTSMPTFPGQDALLTGDSLIRATRQEARWRSEARSRPFLGYGTPSTVSSTQQGKPPFLHLVCFTPPLLSPFRNPHIFKSFLLFYYFLVYYVTVQNKKDAIMLYNFVKKIDKIYCEPETC